MTLIGMLHRRKHPEKVKKAYACAAIAKAEGIDFIYFTPSKVNFEEKTILAWVYESGEWITKKTPFPNVIYNAAAPKTDNQKAVYRELRKLIPFTSHSVGTKVNVYKKIKKGREFAQFLLPFRKINKFSKMMDFLEVHNKVVIKPYSGSKGRNVYFLEKCKENYKIFDGKDEKEISLQKLRSVYRDNFKDQKFLIQKFISCKLKSGLPYDIRMHVQKNGEGKWVVNRIYPRLTGGETPLANISRGGFRGEFDKFLRDQFQEQEFYNVKNYLEQFALMFPPHFESLYNKSFDELGLDVALDENLKLWIYEINWRPGSKTRELDFARLFIPYAKHVAETNPQTKRKNL